jgi:nucleoside-diphosphate-sugar epimerase
MRVLVIGGAGHVGTLVVPALAAVHEVRVFDLKPPTYSDVAYIQGDIQDYAALTEAVAGADALLYMAMNQFRLGHPGDEHSAFDVNVKGVHLALLAAHEAGVKHAVYTSSMSVYQGNLEERDFVDEDMPPDSRVLYGFTKRLGEEVCRNAARNWHMSINALRLCLPTADEKWLAETQPGKATIATTATDVSRALLAALEFQGAGFQAFMISGDYEEKFMRLGKAKRLLHWEPLARPHSD